MCIESTLTCINMTCITTTLFQNDPGDTLEGCPKVFPMGLCIFCPRFIPMFQGTKTTVVTKNQRNAIV